MEHRDRIEFNRKIGNRISEQYEGLHGEIFNPIEQERLGRALDKAVSAIRTEANRLTALDLGCGSGNLTAQLIKRGIHTVSADVSEGFLTLVRRAFGHTGLSEVLRINGRDLSNLESNRFDMVATYSVLHHVPDYLHMVEEMCRVIKPSGVIYIDHEVNEAYYSRPEQYVRFLREARPALNLKRYLRLLLDVKGYIHLLRRIANPRYKREGDIHVWPDDHIEWDSIERLLTSRGFQIVFKEDYLLYKSSYDLQVYEKYRDNCADERVLAARKEK
ncbi:MAG: class I SAM-dependent methyltransferase [Phycisphaerales bacterium]|nr:MAG: class I SAM-dependent methyltransferase [Phycisphaerales bacterium]